MTSRRAMMSLQSSCWKRYISRWKSVGSGGEGEDKQRNGRERGEMAGGEENSGSHKEGREGGEIKTLES